MSNKYISRIANGIKPSGIRKFFDIVASTKDAISLGVGEPDFITPHNIRRAAINSLNKGFTQYTSNAGLPQLRELISKYLKQRFSLNYSGSDEVIVTVGASEALDITLRTLCNPGDEVLIPEPTYVAYAPLVILAGGTPVIVPCSEAEEFKLNPVSLESCITPKSKALLLAYPNNPTGAVMEKERLKPIADLSKKHDLIVISDEIYAELSYGAPHTSIAALPDMRKRTILISGFSKAFAMTGWRVGYVACPKEFMGAILKIHQYSIMCSPTMGQYAAVEALRQGLEDGFEDVCMMRGEYDKRRKFVISRLNGMGLKCFEPMGAFYAFPNVGGSGEDFANKLLGKEMVAVVPGSAFGDACRNNVRISYAYSMERLTLALDRIERFLKG